MQLPWDTPLGILTDIKNHERFQIKLSDYKIKIPSYLGVTVTEPTVNVKATFLAAATPVSATPPK